MCPYTFSHIPQLTLLTSQFRCYCRNGLLLVPCSSSLPEQPLLLPEAHTCAHTAEFGRQQWPFGSCKTSLWARRGCTNLCCALQALLGTLCWENAFTHTKSTSSKQSLAPTGTAQPGQVTLHVQQVHSGTSYICIYNTIYSTRISKKCFLKSDNY